MRYFKKIEGKLVYLSPINIDDLEKYTEWMNNHKTSIYLGNADMTLSLEKEKQFLETLSKESNNFAIISKEKDELLGNCSLFDVNHIHNTAKLGIFIGDEANRARGYGTEAIELLLSFGFNILNLNNIMLQVFSFNQNAISCYKKIGFKEFGRRTQAYLIGKDYYDEIYMELLSKDFKPLEVFKI